MHCELVRRAGREVGRGCVQEGKTFCLRVRMDMSADNKCLRDPVAYRCNGHPHWRTGTTFKCYPTYDFACPFVDATQGVTHALRTSEYKDREEQFYRILAMMRAADPAIPAVHIWDYSRLNFVHTGAACPRPVFVRTQDTTGCVTRGRVQCYQSGSCRSWWTRGSCRAGRTPASRRCRAFCAPGCSCRR